MHFSDIDNIVKLGKWAFGQIPDGNRCKGCILLGEGEQPHKFYYCDLRPGMALMFDEEGAFKDTSCPTK